MHFNRLDLQIKFWFCLSDLQQKSNFSVYYRLIKNWIKAKCVLSI